ncbi:MAG: PTS transporter subunit EIIB, partial [bacterium]
RTFVLRMDLKTPGRGADDEEMKLVSKDEYRRATGLGNLTGDIDCCATRLRLTLKDAARIDQPLLRATGASGVVVKGSGIQVIYGPSVTIVKFNFEELVDSLRSGRSCSRSSLRPRDGR